MMSGEAQRNASKTVEFIEDILDFFRTHGSLGHWLQKKKLNWK